MMDNAKLKSRMSGKVQELQQPVEVVEAAPMIPVGSGHQQAPFSAVYDPAGGYVDAAERRGDKDHLGEGNQQGRETLCII